MFASIDVIAGQCHWSGVRLHATAENADEQLPLGTSLGACGKSTRTNRWIVRSSLRTRRSLRPNSSKAGVGDTCCRRYPSSPPAARWGRCQTPSKQKYSSDLPPPRRALTGRDAAGKSVLKSFEVTPKLVEIDANPGLTFYELYMTEGVPGLTGLEPDPMSAGTKAFPGPEGTIFRLISYPPKRPEGWKPPPGVTFESGLREMSDKIPGMGDHFERGAPGMHTSDTIDYGVVASREMTLELDDGREGPFASG